MSRVSSYRAFFALAIIAFALCLAPVTAWAAEGNTEEAAQSSLGAVSIQANAESPTAGAATPQKAAKAANPMKVKAKSSKISVRYALVRQSNQTIKKSKAFSISKARGKVTFKKVSGNGKITVSKAGKITVKKGLKAGTYKIKVRVKAAGNAKYKAATQTVTLKIGVRGDIKGNISYTTGEKIYHLPGDAYYKSTVIDESYGERWFVTESQAKKAGWRHSYA